MTTDMNGRPALPPFPYVPKLEMKVVSAAVAALEKRFRGLKMATIEDAPGTATKPPHQLQVRVEVSLGYWAPLVFDDAWLQLVPVERRNLEIDLIRHDKAARARMFALNAVEASVDTLFKFKKDEGHADLLAAIPDQQLVTMATMVPHGLPDPETSMYLPDFAAAALTAFVQRWYRSEAKREVQQRRAGSNHGRLMIEKAIREHSDTSSYFWL